MHFYFLDALASLDLKLSVGDSRFFTASASTRLSDYLLPYEQNVSS